MKHLILAGVLIACTAPSPRRFQVAILYFFCIYDYSVVVLVVSVDAVEGCVSCGCLLVYSCAEYI